MGAPLGEKWLPDPRAAFTLFMFPEPGRASLTWWLLSTRVLRENE